MKFINKHAYIITATSGKSFCAAACESFWLIVRNIRLIAALTMVQEFSIIVGKVLIIMVTGALSYMYMASGDLADQANSLIGPTIFVMILAYFMAEYKIRLETQVAPNTAVVPFLITELECELCHAV